MNTRVKVNLHKWRWLGLIPIAIWLYNLIISLFIIPGRFGPQHAAQAWEYVLWSCPFLGLVLGLGILFKNRFLTGAGALWGIYPVFLSDILLITPAAKALAAAQGFSIPFIKLLPEFEAMYELWIGKTGVDLVIIEEFATHWIGNFLFAIIGLVLIGINRWSFLGTAASFLFTAWFTQSLCPFYPPNPPGSPSLFIQAIPMAVIWFVLNLSLFGLIHQSDKRQRILFGFLALYWVGAILLFNSLEEDKYILLLLLGYFALFIIGRIVIYPKRFTEKLGSLYKKRVKWLVSLAFIYLVLFSAFFFVMMRPNLINEGENPAAAYILLGLIPFLVLFVLGSLIIPLLKKQTD